MHPATTAWQGRLRVFDIDLDASTRARPGAPADVLDAEEKRRAGRMATPLLRRRFEAAHVATRHILGAALDVDPASLSFTLGEFGKPALVGPTDRGLHFNLSHCGGRALLAVTDTAVGVDIEAWVERDIEGLAREVLAVTELERFLEMSPDERPRELARIWSAKEALFKACGLGLQIVPASVCIDAQAGWHRLPEPVQAPAWWLQPIEVDGPFCACVATRRNIEMEVTRYAGPV